MKKIFRHKVSFFDSHLIKTVGSILTIIVGLFSGILAFFDLKSKTKLLIFLIMLALILSSYLFLFFKANTIKKLNLFIDDSEITIQEGNIFSKKIFNNPQIIKVFAFNEYFDTQVDDAIISRSSLNGQFIEKKVAVNNIRELDNRIANDNRLKKYIVSKNRTRKQGKKIKYELGSIFKYNDDIFLTALTHFNDKNQAFLSIQDYVRFLIDFWDQIDELYANRTVVITLFGSGITRLEHKMFNNTQILQILLWTFSLRRIKFKKPAKFIILLDETTNKDIDYYKVKVGFHDLQK